MRTTKLFTLILFALTLIALKVFAVVPPFTSLTLAWDKAPSHGTNISYVLKWGALPGATNFNLNVGTNLTAIVTNPTPGILYFHAVARTSDGIESLPSNVVIETNYPARPLQLRITTNTTSSVILEFLEGPEWKHLVMVSNQYQSVVVSRQALILRAKTITPPPLP